MPHLLALLSDSHTECAVKGLLAISAMVRHYSPGLQAFRAAEGLRTLCR